MELSLPLSGDFAASSVVHALISNDSSVSLLPFSVFVEKAFSLSEHFSAQSELIFYVPSAL